jgi:hypothetical protein
MALASTTGAARRKEVRLSNSNVKVAFLRTGGLDQDLLPTMDPGPVEKHPRSEMPVLAMVQHDWWSLGTAYTPKQHVTVSGGVFNFGGLLSNSDQQQRRREDPPRFLIHSKLSHLQSSRPRSYASARRAHSETMRSTLSTTSTGLRPSTRIIGSLPIGPRS